MADLTFYTNPMSRGRIVAEFGPDTTQEAIMAASGESA